jgi:hypothetical protein
VRKRKQRRLKSFKAPSWARATQAWRRLLTLRWRNSAGAFRQFARRYRPAAFTSIAPAPEQSEQRHGRHPPRRCARASPRAIAREARIVRGGRRRPHPRWLPLLSTVMRGLDPRIDQLAKRWVAGSSPAMTIDSNDPIVLQQVFQGPEGVGAGLKPAGYR